MTRSTMMRVFAFALYALALFAVLRMTACAGPPAGTGGAGGTQTQTSTGTPGDAGTQTTTGTPPTGTGGAGGTQPGTGTQEACPPDLTPPCMLYHIPLLGNPSFDIPLRNKYIAAFGDACYMSEVDTFDCFYEKWQAACADAAKIGEVSGNAPYDQGYTCQPVAGTDDYSLQIGADVGQTIFINYQAAPRQTPLTDINGVPTAVNGRYRNLTDPDGVAPGGGFTLNSGVSDGDGGFLEQRYWVLQVNRNANDGGIRSDLAGFEWPCKGSDGGLTKCTEPEDLVDPEKKSEAGLGWEPVAQVHHVVPRGDKRCCSWGTNSYTNAAVISAKLNNYFTNNNPPVDEVNKLNKAKAY
jgi:hypothetical protein